MSLTIVLEWAYNAEITRRLTTLAPRFDNVIASGRFVRQSISSMAYFST